MAEFLLVNGQVLVSQNKSSSSNSVPFPSLAALLLSISFMKETLPLELLFELASSPHAPSLESPPFLIPAIILLLFFSPPLFFYTLGISPPSLNRKESREFTCWKLIIFFPL